MKGTRITKKCLCTTDQKPFSYTSKLRLRKMYFKMSQNSSRE